MPDASICRPVRGGLTRGTERPINTPSPATWVYTENFTPEDDVLDRARARARELGCGSVSSGAGSTLGLLAAALQARSVVEIGTGAGISGTYLLRGMVDGGVLTTIDVEHENQRAARQAFDEAGMRSHRVRTISGRALEVLPRLTDHAYDLVLVDAEPVRAPAYLEQAMRLLRPGGAVIVHEALWRGQVPDPARRDPESTAMREVARRMREEERFLSGLLPVGGGLLVGILNG